MRKDNPYSIGYVSEFPDGSLVLDRPRLNYVKSPLDELHVVTVWDTLWNLAYDKYGNSRFYWILQDVNKIESAFDLLPVGSTIIIPDLQQYESVLG